MATTGYQRLRDNALVRLPTSTEQAINLELFNVIDTCCRKWLLWRDLLNFTRHTPDGPWEAMVPEDKEVVMILLIDPDRRPIEEFITQGERVFITGPLPDGDLVPTLAAFAPRVVEEDPEKWFPSELYIRHYQLLLDGLLGRMMAQSGKPWADRQMAVAHIRTFNSNGAQAKTDTEKGYFRGSQAWTFPFWK